MQARAAKRGKYNFLRFRIPPNNASSCEDLPDQPADRESKWTAKIWIPRDQLLVHSSYRGPVYWQTDGEN